MKINQLCHTNKKKKKETRGTAVGKKQKQKITSTGI